MIAAGIKRRFLRHFEAKGPELARDFGRISSCAYGEGEKEASITTPCAGATIVDTTIAETKKARKKALSGDKAFLPYGPYDPCGSYGPYGSLIDLTLEIAAVAGMRSTPFVSRSSWPVDLSSSPATARPVTARRRPFRVIRLAVP
jgi:hypothetical protein